MLTRDRKIDGFIVIAVAYSVTGVGCVVDRRREVEPLYQKVLAILEQRLGADHHAERVKFER